MKKICTFLAAFCFFFPASSFAQGIYQYWAATLAGGENDNGTFFSTKYDGTGQVNYDYFTSTHPGRSWEFNQPVACNGKLYSILTFGGINDDGVISEYDPATNTYTTKLHLYNVGLTGTIGGMTLLNNKLYGISRMNTNSTWVLFEYNPANNTIQNKHSFVAATGSGAGHEPLALNGKLYGMTYYGGNNTRGVIYEYDPVAGTYTVKHHFADPLSGDASSGFVYYANKIWGISANNHVFSFDPASNVLTDQKNLSVLGAESIYGPMVVLNNKMYAVSSQNGIHDKGFILQYDPVANTAQIEYNFTAATVNNRVKLLLYNNLLYGAGFFGGADDDGELFSYNPVTNTYTSLKTFNSANGGGGEGSMVLYNNKMYGWLLDGGYYSGESALFEFNPANNQFALKVNLGDGELNSPIGQLMYYKNKLYGITSAGGANNVGGIYAFDLQTKSFEQKITMSQTGGHVSDQGGFILYNDVFYGVTRLGGPNDKGTLFKYDPNTNVYTKIFDFGGAAGENPMGQLILFNGKMYGTCNLGSTSDEGSIFEFNPATNAVVPKVAFDGTRGANPTCGLTVYNGRIFGVTQSGGAFNGGALFEYFPLANGLIKLADFKAEITGDNPGSKLVGYDNKLWGVTISSDIEYSGCIYLYDLALGTLTKKQQLAYPIGTNAYSGLVMQYNKFYSLTATGGNNTTGVLFEYDPVNNNYTVKNHFEPMQAKWGRRSELALVPAPAAPGSPNSCVNTATVNITAANANQWIPFTDAQGRATAEINANGNLLGNTMVRLYVNGGNTRQTANGLFYLDRNLTITSANNPVSPVSIRLYVRKTEFESLKATAGSGINVPEDLIIYHNSDFCAATMTAAALQESTTQQDWGFDYVYTADVTTFSSFYFAKLSGALPVKMISFTGATLNNANKLDWKTVCTNDVDFIIQHSVDGIQFDSIGIISATQAMCNGSFNFLHLDPQALSYYRLKLVEENGITSYSKVVVLQRQGQNSFTLQLIPNPVVGSTAQLQATSITAQKLHLQITDGYGKRIWQGSLLLNTGTTNHTLALPTMAPGMYYLQYSNGKEQKTIKMLKQ